jgi:hypothetical protein
MAVEMHVFFRGKLPDKRALSRAMAALGFPLTVPAGSLERQCGFMPMRLRREESGVEFDVFEGRETVEELAGKDIDPSFDRSANFRWAGSEDEMLSGLCAAAALAKLVNGIVLEEQEGKLLSADEAIALARETLQVTLKPEHAQRRGTRPADIKRYLKPLLNQRGDLALIGRSLVIRPVRHVLRGAFLDRTGVGQQFRLWAYLKPLWSRPKGVGYLDYVHDGKWQVWQPHFEPLLMDTLQQDIFEPLGKITTLDDVAGALGDTDHLFSARVILLVLAGERERAEEYVRDIETRHAPENDYFKHWAGSQREFLARDIGEVCAQVRAQEAETVKALKLEAIWEPAPLPVEVPRAERKARTDEPLFVPEPWILRPQWLYQELPERPGDIRFAKDWLLRDGHPVLVAALSREEAEDRHRNGESFLLAARLPNGLLLLLRPDGHDRRDPFRIKYLRRDLPAGFWGFCLELYGLNFSARATYYRRRDVEGLKKLTSVDVYARNPRRCIWHSFFDHETAEAFIHDYRTGDSFDVKKLADNEMERLRCPSPNFGEFEAPAQMVLGILRTTGYGEIT